MCLLTKTGFIFLLLLNRVLKFEPVLFEIIFKTLLNLLDQQTIAYLCGSE